MGDTAGRPWQAGTGGAPSLGVAVVEVRVRAAQRRDNLLTAARFPSERRAMQEYNTNLALAALKEAGIHMEVGSARALVLRNST